MAAGKNREDRAKDDMERREAGRKDTGAGNEQAGAVDGIGGAGGSSGTGSVRAKARNVGDISGIDAELEPEDVPVPGSTGKGGTSSARSRQSSDGGMAGKTRGDDSETVPNQESDDH